MTDKDGCHARDAIRIQNTEVQINRGLTSMDQIDPEINLAWLHPPRLKKLKILNQFDVNCLQMKLLNPNIMLKRHFNRKFHLPPYHHVDDFLNTVVSFPVHLARTKLNEISWLRTAEDEFSGRHFEPPELEFITIQIETLQQIN